MQSIIRVSRRVPPHYHGHRERLRVRFREAGSEAVSDYELLELVLFRAIPQRDIKPLAKELIAKFGSFAEVVAAPTARPGAEAAGSVLLVERDRLLPHRHGLCREGAIPPVVSRRSESARR
jgi:hypothetical protein